MSDVPNSSLEFTDESAALCGIMVCSLFALSPNVEAAAPGGAGITGQQYYSVNTGAPAIADGQNISGAY